MRPSFLAANTTFRRGVSVDQGGGDVSGPAQVLRQGHADDGLDQEIGQRLDVHAHSAAMERGDFAADGRVRKVRFAVSMSG